MKKTLLAIALIAIAVISRFTEPAPNFTAVLAVALFAGAYLGGARGTLVAFGSMAFSDALWMYYHPGQYHFGIVAGVDYLAVILVMVIGMALTMHGKEIGGKKVVPASFAGSLAGSIAFFLISNFGVWAASGMYPITWNGFVACYVAAVPFFGNTFLSTFAYSFVLFAAYEVALKAIRGFRLTRGIMYN